MLCDNVDINLYTLVSLVYNITIQSHSKLSYTLKLYLVINNSLKYRFIPNLRFKAIKIYFIE